ncbi:MAG: ABC transporter substrate-binding protein [Oscillospiraceae bacterium]
MKAKYSSILLSLVLAFCLLMSACGSSGGSAATSAAPETAPAESTAPAETTGSGTSDINIAQCTDITSLDPQGHNSVSSGNVTRMLYDCLIRLDTDGTTFVPMLADSWEWLDDNTIEFKLKQGVHFHNGDELTSEDVLYTFDRMAQSGFCKHLITMITDSKIIDDYTFDLTVSDESAALLSSLAHQCAGIVDKSYTEDLEASGKTLSEAPNGTGPYKFDYWNAGSDCRLAAFDDYYDDNYAAKNSGLVFKYYPEESSAVIALETGEVDVLLDVPSTSISELKSNPDITLNEFESTELTYIALNSSSGVFADSRLREALAYAINRDDIIQVAVDGYGVPDYAPIGVAAIGYTDTKVKHEYDPDKAKELMTEAGYPDGFEFTLQCYPALQKAAQVVQNACLAVGITCNIQVTEEAQLCASAGMGQHDAGMGYWFANAEPDNSYSPLFHSDNNLKGGYNWINIADPDLDSLIEEARKIADPNERLEKYGEINDYICENAYWIPLISEEGFVATRADVKGIVLYAIEMHLFQGITK